MYFVILMKSSIILSICRLRLILAKQICFQDLKSDSSLNEQSLDLETRYTLCGQVSITNYVFYAILQKNLLLFL